MLGTDEAVNRGRCDPPRRSMRDLLSKRGIGFLSLLSLLAGYLFFFTFEAHQGRWWAVILSALGAIFFLVAILWKLVGDPTWDGWALELRLLLTGGMAVLLGGGVLLLGGDEHVGRFDGAVSRRQGLSCLPLSTGHSGSGSDDTGPHRSTQGPQPTGTGDILRRHYCAMAGEGGPGTSSGSAPRVTPHPARPI